MSKCRRLVIKFRRVSGTCFIKGTKWAKNIQSSIYLARTQSRRFKMLGCCSSQLTWSRKSRPWNQVSKRFILKLYFRWPMACHLHHFYIPFLKRFKVQKQVKYMRNVLWLKTIRVELKIFERNHSMTIMSYSWITFLQKRGLKTLSTSQLRMFLLLAENVIHAFHAFPTASVQSLSQN